MAHALVIGEPFNLKVFAFQSWLGLRLLTGDIYKTTEASAAPSEWHIGRWTREPTSQGAWERAHNNKAALRRWSSRESVNAKCTEGQLPRRFIRTSASHFYNPHGDSYEYSARITAASVRYACCGDLWPENWEIDEKIVYAARFIVHVLITLN